MENKKLNGTKRALRLTPTCGLCKRRKATERIRECDTGREVRLCSQCHSRGNSRLAGLTGFYLPGRDRNRAVDLLGGMAVLGALAGGLAHGAARIVTWRRRNRR